MSATGPRVSPHRPSAHKRRALHLARESSLLLKALALRVGCEEVLAAGAGDLSAGEKDPTCNAAMKDHLPARIRSLDYRTSCDTSWHRTMLRTRRAITRSGARRASRMKGSW